MNGMKRARKARSSEGVAFPCTSDVLQSTVPATIAERPGPWYNRLATYKTGEVQLDLRRK